MLTSSLTTKHGFVGWLGPAPELGHPEQHGHDVASVADQIKLDCGLTHLDPVSTIKPDLSNANRLSSFYPYT